MADRYPATETGQALQRIADDGSDMSQPMEFDFFIAVSSEDVGQKVADLVATRGFSSSVECDDESGDWTCYCTKIIVPAYKTVCAIERELQVLVLAKTYCGSCF